MKKLTAFLCLLLLFSLSFSQTSVAPMGGDGSAGNPYQIEALENLYWITQDVSRLSLHYVQIVDIDASATHNWFYNGNGGYRGFPPIGDATNRFAGSYDGQGNSIKNLYMNMPDTDDIALFGHTNYATISNLQLKNAEIHGKRRVAGIIGYANHSTVENCSVDGSIFAENTAAGIVAYSFNLDMSNCFVTGQVIGEGHYIGGVIGGNHSGDITNCYNHAYVSGDSDVGGLAGYHSSGLVSDCYSTGKVVGLDPNYTGGLFGERDGSYSNCFWDYEAAEIPGSNGGLKKTTAEMKTDSTFIAAGWDFAEDWTMDDLKNNGYPYLQWQQYGEVFIINIPEITEADFTVRYSVETPYETCGICWNTSGNPSTSDNKTLQSTTDSLGAKVSQAIDLVRNTKYYVRAFLQRSGSVIYSEQMAVSSGVFQGRGTEAQPYLISDLDQLRWISEHPDLWGKHYKQLNNIDASPTATWNDGEGWSSIGSEYSSRFTGSYDGQNFVIDGLTANRPNKEFQSLFGCADGAKVSNVHLTNIDIYGEYHCGGLVGLNLSGRIDNCSVSGSVRGYRFIGGLIGENGSGSLITNCFSEGNVNVAYLGTCGGLVGSNNGSIKYSYSSVWVSGSGDLGGFVGSNSGFIWGCYSTGGMTGNSGSNGGFVGVNRGQIYHCYSRGGASGYGDVGGFVGESGGTILNCYSTGTAQATGSRGGFAGTTGGMIYNCFWDTETSQMATSLKGKGRTSSELKTDTTFTNNAWSFVHHWEFREGENDGYPVLKEQMDELETVAPAAGNGSEEDPYQILTLENLYWVSQNDDQWDKHYIQMDDIDATQLAYFTLGWQPLGRNRQRFTGSYNGNGHIIDNLYCFQRSINFVGMFGCTEDAMIRDLGLPNAHIWGLGRVGGIAGQSDMSEIINTYTSGHVLSTYNYVGGLVGWSDSTMITDCYSRANCKGYTDVAGGLAGFADNHSCITNSYFGGKVSGSKDIGGLIGKNDSSSVVNGFWDMDISGLDSSAGGTGRSTANMKTESNFTDAGWNFTDTWLIDLAENDGYPILKWELFGADVQPQIIPENYVLEQNYPNPFNPTTTITYRLPESASIKIDIYDISGRKVRTLVDLSATSGSYSIVWNGRNDMGGTVASGIYIYRMMAGDKVLSRKMLFLK